ncbi:MAG: arylsulfatase [Candidatus Marinimicrobia bacterium]|nr:arylsulfatase [Candidatus Neomarinimicrobiota bacterium]
MKTTFQILGILFLIIYTSCNEPTPSPSSDLPNIIIILADDLGYGDIGVLNPDSKIPTPNLDRLASEGIIFSDAHSPSAVCTPTRYGLLTGRYSFRTRLQSGVLVGHAPSLIEPARITVASLLKESGYHAASVGKWHLGLDFKKKNSDVPLYAGDDWDIESTENIDYQAIVDGGPCDHGFDYSFILPASLDMQPYVFINNKYVFQPEINHIDGVGVLEDRGLFWRHGDASRGFDFWQVLPLLTQKANRFIRDHVENHPKQPFFLYFPLTAPHMPWLPTDEFKGKSQAGDYGDFVAQVDYSVGQVMNLIDSLEIAENTLVFFTSDNGSHWLPEEIEQFDHKANYIFRGMKSDVWEGGHRVPLLVKWPNVIQGDSRSDQMACLTDMLATFAELTGKDMPWNTGEDSFSFLYALEGKNPTWPVRYTMINHSANGLFALRNGEWKFIDGRGSGGWSYEGKETEPPGQLYNLTNDPGETANLYNQYPEKVEEMKNMLEMYKKEQRSRFK